MSQLFKNAIQNTPRMSKTHNGADTYESSLNPVTDLFFLIGSSRGKDITRPFEAALGADENKTLRMLFWARDIRGGAGERETFRSLMKHLEDKHTLSAIKLVKLVPEYGRWDDLLIFTKKRVKEAAYEVIKQGLADKNGLCAKWMPRKGAVARELREYLKLSPKAYRKTVVSLSSTVETQMCAKKWDRIDFNKVPSLASARYQKAFEKNAQETYGAWKEALNSKDPEVRATAKVNAGAVYPHDVVKSIFTGDADVAKAQWEALPNFMADNLVLPIIDVSGSMTWCNIGNSNVRPIDVSVSLGLYVADKQSGAFKDVVCHFSGDSKLEVLQGDIVNKVNQIQRMEWGGNTDIERAFNNILRLAVQNKVPHNEMPKMLLIMSDMEFDVCSRGTAYKTAKAAFGRYGYELPRVVFWNLNAREGNNPVTFKTDGTALVSGYSPNILKAVLEGNFEKYTPESIMDAAIMSSRYDPVENAMKA